MKKVAVLMLCLAASGCSGLKKHIEDTFWPLRDPNMPHSESENFRRVRGEPVVEAPLVAQNGDVWPGQPDAVPTIQDVNNPNSHFSRMFRNSLQGLNADLDQQQLANGESLSTGEEVARRRGVQRSSSAIGPALPSHVPDHAAHYLEGPNRDTVAIPNGDGTTTLVAPDGKVRVVRGNPALSTQNVPPSASAPEMKQEGNVDKRARPSAKKTKGSSRGKARKEQVKLRRKLRGRGAENQDTLRQKHHRKHKKHSSDISGPHHRRIPNKHDVSL